MLMTNDEKQRPGCTYDYDVTDTRDGRRYAFTAQLLGQATSHRARHSHGTDNACRACRWIEVSILRRRAESTGEGNGHERPPYVVVEVGRSTLPGETDRITVTETLSPYAVMEALSHSRDATIPRVARFALAEAAARDVGIEAVWIERPV